MTERLARCPQCNLEVQPNYRFCQNCGFKLWQIWDGRNLAALFGAVEPGEKVHSLAKYKLWRIGNELGFHAITEFVPPRTELQNRSELINVVWKFGDNIEFAFETRSKESDLSVVDVQDDIEKLRNLECQKKFIVNVSTKTGKAYFNEISDKTIAHHQVLSCSKSPDDKPVLNLPNLSEIVERFGVVSPGKDVRKQAETKLRKIGTGFGFSSHTQYEVPDLLNDGKTRFISVVWKAGNDIAVAFQIRRKRINLNIARSRRDKLKLLHLQAKEKYLVNVSEKTGQAYFFGETEWRTHQSSSNLEEAKTYGLEDPGSKHARAYEAWTEVEDSQLIGYYNKGASVFQLAKKHQRSVRAMVSRLKRLGLVDSQNILEDFKTNEAKTVTVLVKSEKHGKICLACVDDRRRWIRPIKPGGFDEKDIVMDNGKILQIFDVVKMNFRTPFPIKHHRENMLLGLDNRIRFVRRLSESEQHNLLSEIAANNILSTPNSREELYDQLDLILRQSLALAGPVDYFEVQCNIVSGKTHPRIWIVKPHDKKRIFSVTCTDLAFNKFIGEKMANLTHGDEIISLDDVAELKDKQTYFVIGLTGDSLGEDNEIKDGKYAPPGSSIQPRYWPMIVSVLTIPHYRSEGQE